MDIYELLSGPPYLSIANFLKKLQYEKISTFKKLEILGDYIENYLAEEEIESLDIPLTFKNFIGTQLREEKMEDDLENLFASPSCPIILYRDPKKNNVYEVIQLQLSSPIIRFIVDENNRIVSAWETFKREKRGVF